MTPFLMKLVMFPAKRVELGDHPTTCKIYISFIYEHHGLWILQKVTPDGLIEGGHVFSIYTIRCILMVFFDASVESCDTH